MARSEPRRVPTKDTPESVDTGSGGGRLVELTPPTVEGLYHRYAAYVAAVGHKLLGRPEEVDDLVQEVFIQAQRDLNQLHSPHAVRGWLAMIAVRTSQRMLKRRRLRAWLRLDEVADYLQLAAPDASPEHRELLAHIYERLDKLPAPIRVAWSLRRLEERSLEDVAALCECSLATVKRRITKAELALQEVFND